MPKQEQHTNLMCRLAVGDEPLGDFWKNPETSIQKCRKRHSDHAMIQGIAQLFDSNQKNNKTTPLTSDPRSKPELVSVL